VENITIITGKSMKRSAGLLFNPGFQLIHMLATVYKNRVISTQAIASQNFHSTNQNEYHNVS
jgi:hypothetical protein